jgi:branched-chain amino acid transport system ATP-binding protein
MAESGTLELRGVTAGYGEIVTVRDVSLTVRPGAVTALLGANGAGKTTLLNVVSGLVPVRDGSVALDGRDITRFAPHSRVRAGLRHIPEKRGIFPSLTVRDNLRLHGRRGSEKAAITRAVESFPILGDRLGQVAGTLSGGQQQMLAIARAYDPAARVILVDEASLGLAPVVVDEIFEFLARVQVGLLLVEQYVTRALALAEQAYILSAGSMTWSGAAKDLDKEQVFEHYLRVDEPT